ncbi:uncharacterized protein LOC135714987 [Ochlerotatus camptorhynchus]|uniref:uncharacterized protein LOC135714987 n=1 Tax=Ochlerotatus camptorhynchus TaxID=644619 RepID=UPI0031E3F0AE
MVPWKHYWEPSVIGSVVGSTNSPFLSNYSRLIDEGRLEPAGRQSYLDALFEFPTLKRESAAELHSLVEKFEANVKVLKQLGEKTEFWDIILIRMLSIRLDPTTRRDWEEYSSTKDAIAFNNLTSFIQRRVTVLQTIQGKVVEAPVFTQQLKKSAQRPVASYGASQFNSGRKCIVGSDHHPLYLCLSFAKLDLVAKKRELCSEEKSVAANSRTTDSSQTKTPTTSTSGEQPMASVLATLYEPTSYASTGQARKNVLLATAVVNMVDDNGTAHVARALLDSGSECCFITESFSQLVKAKRYKVSVPISGIGQSSTYARYKIVSTVHSRVCDYSTSAEFLVLPKVTIDLPTASFDASSWKIPPGVQLADPAFYNANPIDIIIGAEVFFDQFKVSGRIQLGNSLPTLVNSVLGWIVSGKASYGTPTTPVIANVATVAELHQWMEKFWAIEENDTSPCYSVEEAACEEHFQRTVRRNSEGRYIVRLPIKDDVIKQIGDNRRTAVRRFRMLEGRLGRNSELAQQYRDFIDEYLALGHMKQVFDYQSPPSPCYHMPHHAVVREESTTTKLRVVFDASCRTPEGPSLNDALMVGPTVQQEIRSIIMRSRIRRVMIIADAKQMYRQVLVDERDTPLLRIVWTPSLDQPLATYELLTVTYGTASAPFLATRVLLQLADDEKDSYPEAAEVLRKDFYVDDLFSGANSIEEATTLRQQLEALLARGGFQLRKWASNEEAVLEGLAPENRALKASIDLDRDQCIKSLGLHWEPASDQLKYRIELPADSTDFPLTKRIALSQIARLFDPLGLLGPVVISAKLFMQALWTLKDDDDVVVHKVFSMEMHI